MDLVLEQIDVQAIVKEVQELLLVEVVSEEGFQCLDAQQIALYS